MEPRVVVMNAQLGWMSCRNEQPEIRMARCHQQMLQNWLMMVLHTEFSVHKPTTENTTRIAGKTIQLTNVAKNDAILRGRYLDSCFDVLKPMGAEHSGRGLLNQTQVT